MNYSNEYSHFNQFRKGPNNVLRTSNPIAASSTSTLPVRAPNISPTPGAYNERNFLHFPNRQSPYHQSSNQVLMPAPSRNLQQSVISINEGRLSLTPRGEQEKKVFASPSSYNNNFNQFQLKTSRKLQQGVINFNDGVSSSSGSSDKDKKAFAMQYKASGVKQNRELQELTVQEQRPIKVPRREETVTKTKKIKNDTMRIYTGTAAQIINWSKKEKNYFCLYELFASVVSIQQGTVRLQQVMLLRDKKGPIIQVVHYVNDHINIENFFVGQMLRCMGRMIGPNIMHAVSIREAQEEEIITLQRISYICDDAVSKTTK